jgi:hypothetical protein
MKNAIQPSTTTWMALNHALSPSSPFKLPFCSLYLGLTQIIKQKCGFDWKCDIAWQFHPSNGPFWITCWSIRAPPVAPTIHSRRWLAKDGSAHHRQDRPWRVSHGEVPSGGWVGCWVGWWQGAGWTGEELHDMPMCPVFLFGKIGVEMTCSYIARKTYYMYGLRDNLKQ